jgi:hypothetical protein
MDGMNDEELFKLAVSTRQFEIQMFWQRSSYFMVLNTAIAIAFFSLKEGMRGAIVALLGVLACIVWCMINLGSKYWQIRWEEAAARFEKQCAPEAKLFSASSDEIQAVVKNHLDNGSHTRLKRWHNAQILRKPSVSSWMLILSFCFTIIWVLLFFVSLCA